MLRQWFFLALQPSLIVSTLLYTVSLPISRWVFIHTSTTVASHPTPFCRRTGVSQQGWPVVMATETWRFGTSIQYGGFRQFKHIATAYRQADSSFCLQKLRNIIAMATAETLSRRRCTHCVCVLSRTEVHLPVLRCDCCTQVGQMKRLQSYLRQSRVPCKQVIL